MRDEFFWDISTTLFAHNERDFIEKSAKMEMIVELVEDNEDEVLEFLREHIGERVFNMTLERYHLERSGKNFYGMEEEELKNRLFDMMH